MRDENDLFGTIVVLTAMLAWTQGVDAENLKQMSCPDMSAHTKVLNDGIEKLKSIPAPERKTDRRSIEQRLSGDEFGGTNVWNREPIRENPLSDKQIKNLSLNTAADQQFADHQVSLLELDEHFDTAEDLLQKILQIQRNRADTDKRALVITLNHLARVHIEKEIQTQKPLMLIPLPDPRSHNFVVYGMGATGIRMTRLAVIPYLEEILDNGVHINSANFDSALNFFTEAQKEKNLLDQDSPLPAEFLVLLEVKGKLKEARKEYLLELPKLDYGSIEMAFAIAQFCNRHDDLVLARKLQLRLINTSSPACSNLLQHYLAHSHDSEAIDFFAAASDSLSPDLHRPQLFNQNDIAAITPILPDRLKEQVLSYLDHCFFSEKFTAESGSLLDVVSKRWKGFSWEFFESLNREFIPLQDLQSLILLGHYFSTRDQRTEAAAVYTKVLSSLTNSTEPNFVLKNELCLKLLMATNTDSVEKTKDGAALIERIARFKEKCENRITTEECIAVSKKLDTTGFKLELSGSYHEAERMYRESLQIKEKNLGVIDEETLQTLSDLARVVGQQGRINEASSLYERSLAAYRKNVVAKDNFYARLLDAYGQCLASNKQNKKAELVYDEERAYHSSVKSNK